MSKALYNEIEPFACAWLGNLISKGLITSGEIVEKSIEDIIPYELDSYPQCHFFAGIGVWSYALRLAGWPDDRPVWTGSCPCQPFSAAGKRKGTADERHLWPAFFHLIQVKRPITVFGEQVASPDGLSWCDTVFADLESQGYSCGAVDTCAAGFGAPHIRQRLYWFGTLERIREQGGGRTDQLAESVQFGRRGRDNGNPARLRGKIQTAGRSTFGGMVCSESCGRQQGCNSGIANRLGNTISEGLQGQPEPERNTQGREKQTGRIIYPSDVFGGMGGTTERPCPTNGFWENPDWLWCRDKKWRAVEPNSTPLADGIANRVGRLRGYGNAIVAPQAAAFIRAVMEMLE